MMKTYDSLADAIADVFGGNTQIENRIPVSGGDINHAYQVSLSNGEKAFMKANSRENISFFAAEATGLSAIRKTGTVNAPEVLALGTDSVRDSSFLLMEYIEPGRSTGSSQADLGERVARMHLSSKDIYNLYHLLNHLNMFGGGYLHSVISIVNRFV